MTEVLDRPSSSVKRPMHSTYMDDCGIGGQGVDPTWSDTMAAMKRVARAGLPINIWKCELLVARLKMLGMMLAANRYHLGNKAM